MSIKCAKVFFLGILFIFTAGLQAKVKLPTILANNMVLQQKTSVKLWGWATTNAKVKVTGSWDKKRILQLQTLKAVGCSALIQPMPVAPFRTDDW
jgi:hypothetical protein